MLAPSLRAPGAERTSAACCSLGCTRTLSAGRKAGPLPRRRQSRLEQRLGMKNRLGESLCEHTATDFDQACRV